MEVPRGAWADDPGGARLAGGINAHLPPDIRVFGAVPVNKSFSARRACKARTYHYLLPLSALGPGPGPAPGGPAPPGDAGQRQLEAFRSLLALFEGRHAFQNYTIRGRYRPKGPRPLAGAESPGSPGASLPPGGPPLVVTGNGELSDNSCADTGGAARWRVEDAGRRQGPPGWEEEGDREVRQDTTSSRTAVDLEGQEENSAQDLGREHSMAAEGTEEDDGRGAEEEGWEEGPLGEGDLGGGGTAPVAWWEHEPPPGDAVGAAHFRTMIECRCGAAEEYDGTRFVRIVLKGESFMIHQIRKMVGTAVVAARGKLPRDLIPASLAKHARVVLPLAPAEGLILVASEFHPFRTGGQVAAPPPATSSSADAGSGGGGFAAAGVARGGAGGRLARLEMPPGAAAEAEAFWRGALRGVVASRLDDTWRAWLADLDGRVLVPEHEARHVVGAWEAWRTQASERFKAETARAAL